MNVRTLGADFVPKLTQVVKSLGLKSNHGDDPDP